MPSCTTEKIEAKRAEILARDDTDPVLSYAYCAADYGVSLATFKRSILAGSGRSRDQRPPEGGPALGPRGAQGAAQLARRERSDGPA
jgi:hypothetical protein